MLLEKINARGHKNILARHKTTLEITKDGHLTLQGDCIVAVSADRGPAEFSKKFLEALKNEDVKLEIMMQCDGIEEKVVAYGHPHLSFTNPHEMVVRKSNFVCARTLAIKADKSSNELSREFVKKLSEGGLVKIELRIT
jgi:uncharacterized protein